MAQVDAQTLDAIIDAHRPDLAPFEDVYRDIHRNPELGTHERRTSEIASRHLRALGFDVTDRIGGYGVVGTLANGPGRTVLLRADMDALPIEEATGLPYASAVRFRDPKDGAEHPVMHACGHDMHVTTLMVVAALLAAARDRWSGTLTCVFQPNEENGAGAMAMVKDGLFDHAPAPDIVFAQHVDHRRAGNLAIRAGPCLSATDAFLVTLHGKSGHGSKPESCVDPVVMGCHVVVRLQTIVSRVVAPADAAVITCGSFHAGSAHNIIPATAQFRVSIRTYDAQTRTRVLAAVEQVIRAECAAAGAPSPPTIERTHEYPLTSNDATLTREVRALFANAFGPDRVEEMEKSAVSEDFANLAIPHNAPYVMWYWGATATDTYDAAARDGTLDGLPPIHSADFAPSVRPTLETGVRALALAALRYLN